MLSGIGGEAVTHYVGLLCDAPANLAALIAVATAARRMATRIERYAWSCFAAALAVYLTGTAITIVSWLNNIDPFPGPADLPFSAFYPAMMLAAALLIRAAAIRVTWSYLAWDGAIFVSGFGTLFWFLVNRPTAGHTEVDFVRALLGEAYASLDCVILLLLGILLLTGVAVRRVSLFLIAGFALMFWRTCFGRWRR